MPGVPTAYAAAAVAAAAVGDPAADRITHLREQERALKDERKRIASEVRKETKKKARLVEKAKLLTDADLLAVLGSRAVAKAKAKGKPKGKAKAKAKAA